MHLLKLLSNRDIFLTHFPAFLSTSVAPTRWVNSFADKDDPLVASGWKGQTAGQVKETVNARFDRKTWFGRDRMVR